MLTKQLTGERWRECSIWEMFFNWSIMVSISGALAPASTGHWVASSAVSCCAWAWWLVECLRFWTIVLPIFARCSPCLQTPCQTTVAIMKEPECGHRCSPESIWYWATRRASLTTRCSLKPKNQSTEVLPRAALSANTLCWGMRPAVVTDFDTGRIHKTDAATLAQTRAQVGAHWH